jgi:uncharacterized repeat protein (TIGR03803 family)
MLALALAMLGVWSVERANAQLTILHRFGDGSVPNDGVYPLAALAVGPDNDLYGGTGNKAQYISGDSGTVFRITPSGKLTIIRSFAHKQYMSSDQPLLNYKGTLVGVTGTGLGPKGAGTLFELSPAFGSQEWNLNIAFKFGRNNVLVPSGSVIVGSDGDFYGTTEGMSSTSGAGTIYKMDPQTFALTVLYNFNNSGAMYPQGALLQGSDGNFYGSTEEFASNFTASIFMMTPEGQVTILSQIPGQFSYVGHPLIQASDGNYYGSFGSSADKGFIFKMTPDHVVTTIHTFQGGDGRVPNGLVQGPNGDLYGTTVYGGAAGKGVVFEISTDGSLFTVLHNFGDGTITHDGETPAGSLVVGPDNFLYGTTSEGGIGGFGTVFKISPSQ